MPHAIHRVTRFEIVAPHALKVQFEDGSVQRINFEPVLHGLIFGPLRDLATFNAVALDPEAGTLTWPNGADFDPATLHDWPSVCGDFAARAREWANQQRTSEDMEPLRR
jgi:hypothetical protein